MEITIARPGRKSNIDYSQLPNQARSLREAKGLSLRVIARKIKVHWNALAQFEMTGTGIGKVRQYALAVILETNVDTLLTPGQKHAEEATKKFNSEVQNILDIVQ